jgi:hypothetical protein
MVRYEILLGVERKAARRECSDSRGQLTKQLLLEPAAQTRRRIFKKSPSIGSCKPLFVLSKRSTYSLGPYSNYYYNYDCLFINIDPRKQNLHPSSVVSA